jgi:hypothetical protein
MIMQTPGKRHIREKARKKGLPGLLKRDAGESEPWRCQPHDKPASRGLDDPGLGAVFPQPRTGGDVSHRSTTTRCRQCHTSLVAGHSSRARKTTRCAPRGREVYSMYLC